MRRSFVALGAHRRCRRRSRRPGLWRRADQFAAASPCQVGEADLMMGADATLSDKTAKKRKKPDEPEPTEVRRGRVRFSFSLSVSRPAPHPSLPSRPSVPRYQYVALPVCRATSKTRYQ